MEKLFCIYHGNCQDGFAAAWAVRSAHFDAEFYPGVYQNEPPEVTGRGVVMVDFCYKAPEMIRLVNEANSVVVIDHHASVPPEMDLVFAAIGNANGKLRFVFDKDRSGAGLAWDYFHPDCPRPKLIDHIEDRDLWRFKLPNTKLISVAVFSYPYEFELWDYLMAEDTLTSLIVEGEAIERKLQQDLTNLLPVTQRSMVIGGMAMPVANLPLTLTSDAGHQMATGADGIAACYWDTPEGRVFSLRSTDDGPDCQAIAVKYGGGGHVHAAGFRMPLCWEGDP